MHHHNHKKIKKQTGFTMIELMVVMIIITILSATFIPHIFNFEKKRADLVISEIWTIIEAVQLFDTQEGDTPDSATLCWFAIKELQDDSFLSGFEKAIIPESESTPHWKQVKTALGAGSYYSTICQGPGMSADTVNITLTLNDISESWTDYIVNQLPGAEKTTNIRGNKIFHNVKLVIPKLAYVPVLKHFLYLDGSITATTNSNTTLTATGGVYKGKRGLIEDVIDVKLSERQGPGESLQYAVFSQGLKKAGDSTGGTNYATVTKPNCDFDGDHILDATPTIVVIPSSIAAQNGEEIVGWNARAENNINDDSVWYVWIELSTAGGFAGSYATVTAGSTLFYSTKCAP